MENNDGSNTDLPVEGDGDLPIELAGETPSADEQPPSEDHHLRLQRVRDYQTRALANANLLESNLGSINSGLLRIALRLEETIEEAMARTPVPVERMQRVYRDRGEPCGSAPPTPPGVRVRTTAVRLVAPNDTRPPGWAFSRRVANDVMNARESPRGFTPTSTRVAPTWGQLFMSLRSRHVLATPFTRRIRGRDRSGLWSRVRSPRRPMHFSYYALC